MSGQHSVSLYESWSKQVGIGAGQSSLEDWLHLIQSEYLEIPGLHLTRNQVQRLWSLDSGTCDLVLRSLVGMGFLRVTDTGTYVRADFSRG